MGIFATLRISFEQVGPTHLKVKDQPNTILHAVNICGDAITEMSLTDERRCIIAGQDGGEESSTAILAV